MTEGRRPHLLVLNQYYWPGVEATGQLLADLCRALTDEFDVTVITGMVRFGGKDGEPGRTVRDGVQIVRVRSTSFDRAKLHLRATNYATYLAQSVRHAFGARKADVVLCMTDPPIIADVALAVGRRFEAPLVVVSQDVFPEIAVELKRLENPVVVGLLRIAIDYYLRRADRVVAIGETMRRRLEAKGARPDRVRVIPNWVDTKALTPRPHENEWARAHDLPGKFVVMHSGNVGHAQNLDALIRAATFLRDLEDLRIVIVGEGARRMELGDLARRLETDNVVFLRYQPREVLPESLSAAHVHVVGLAKGLSGFVVPSRLYGVLSVARPVIVAADVESETAQIVERAGAGVVVPPGRPELVARAIRQAYNREFDLVAMGERARAYVIAEADRAVAISRYRALLHELVGRAASNT